MKSSAKVFYAVSGEFIGVGIISSYSGGTGTSNDIIADDIRDGVVCKKDNAGIVGESSCYSVSFYNVPLHGWRVLK